ncbi:hypothetical protein BS47DRAFT_612675 [Hydnum rufescens UP504]|uniref:C2H2-type domain-containing protein n=1 Tax=Hydnum rufescens UP504 TaxID=1448309 RepID=A0A9P6B5W4_9AGAM|nr:hypothetical protein BS47DRAFT_612675 [Hydnum rufescens UP504]
MAKKKNKLVLRPWCWYCEREFEDEKVLMQHQKAKHYKCRHCPRKLNTAGGLAVHIQQVHKLDPEKIENALPGRDGGEVEIFGMEGIPKNDAEAWKRRKEAEAGVAAGSTSQPQAKRPKVDKKPLSDVELAAQLAAHKALMSGSDVPSVNPTASGTTSTGAPIVYGAPQTYAVPPAPIQPPGPPVAFPNGAPPFPDGRNLNVPLHQSCWTSRVSSIPSWNAASARFSSRLDASSWLPTTSTGGCASSSNQDGWSSISGHTEWPPRFPSGGAAAWWSGPTGPGAPPHLPPGTPGSFPPPAALASGSVNSNDAGAPPNPRASESPRKVPPLIAPILEQENPPIKSGTILIWEEANHLPAEKRAQDLKYAYSDVPLPVEQSDEAAEIVGDAAPATQARGTKRARAEDFL